MPVIIFLTVYAWSMESNTALPNLLTSGLTVSRAVERMNRTIKEATTHRYHYQTTDELSQHLQTFLLAYNHAKRLKTLKGLTPYEFVLAQWQVKPTIFTRDPTQLTLGLYT